MIDDFKIQTGTALKSKFESQPTDIAEYTKDCVKIIYDSAVQEI